VTKVIKGVPFGQQSLPRK